MGHPSFFCLVALFAAVAPSRPPLVTRLLQQCNDVETNPGPPSVKFTSPKRKYVRKILFLKSAGSGKNKNSLNRHGGNGGRSANGGAGGGRFARPASSSSGKVDLSSFSTDKSGEDGVRMSHHGTGAFIPREVLDPKPTREERQRSMVGRLDTLETKFNALVDELTKHKDTALQLAQKNQLIDDLNSRVRALEDLVVKRSSGKEGDFQLHVASREAMEAVQERLRGQADDMDRIKVDLGEVMHVYDDIQDRLYDIDRTWKNNLAFYGIKLDPGGLHENHGCLEVKVRNVLKNKLNIGREIVIMRCQRVFNGVDSKGNKPIIVNFQKWSDKEEILRKSKILKNSGISVEEDFSRAAKHRRRELEKLVKEIRSIDPDRKCQFKYDKLMIDDDVFVYNDVERRIERLPYTVTGHTSNLEDPPATAPGAIGGGGGRNTPLPSLLQEDTPSATLGRHRPRGHTSHGFPSRPAWRTKSVESVLGKIPDVTSGSLGGAPSGVGGGRTTPSSNGGATAVMRALTASVSTPSLVARERARASAREKMTPNLDLDNDDGGGDDDENGDNAEKTTTADDDFRAVASDPEPDIRVTGSDVTDGPRDGYGNSLHDQEMTKKEPDTRMHNGSHSSTASTAATTVTVTSRTEASAKRKKQQLLEVGSSSGGPSRISSGLSRVGAGGGLNGELTEEDEEEYLPLNNVVDWDEWTKTGSYVPPRKRRGNGGGGGTAPGEITRKIGRGGVPSSSSQAKLKSKYSKKATSNGSGQSVSKLAKSTKQSSSSGGVSKAVVNKDQKPAIIKVKPVAATSAEQDA